MAVNLSSPVSAPPRKNSATRKPVIVDKSKQRTEALNGLLQAGLAASVMVGNYADVGAISKHGPQIVPPIVSLAETNSTIAAGLDMILKAGPYSALLAAVLPFGLQIAANHGWRTEALVKSGLADDPKLLAQETQSALSNKYTPE